MKKKVIKVVKLTEKERKKYTKKFNCKRCHDFFVETREELEHHMEQLHGEYSLKKHQEAKGIDRKFHKIYMERNRLEPNDKNGQEIIKLRPTSPCYVTTCKNCEKAVAIHSNLEDELQNNLLCPTCGADVFMDNRDKIINHMVMKGLTPAAYREEYNIDTTKFKGYEEQELKLKVKGRTLGDFVKRRK